MVEVEVGRVPVKEPRFVGQARRGILGRVARDGAGRFDGRLDALEPEVGGARVAAPLPK
jgi:hypothetical protein